MIDLMLMSAVLMMQDPGPESEPESAGYTILLAAREAMQEVKNISYDAVFAGVGSRATRFPRVEGRVLLARSEYRWPDLKIEGVRHAVDRELQGVVTRISCAVKSNHLNRIDYDRELIASGAPSFRQLDGGGSIFVQEFIQDVAFSEMTGSDITLAGRVYVEDVLCDAVYFGEVNRDQVRWYFGVEDHLPRRIERLRTINNEIGGTILTLSNLKVNEELEKDAFVLDAPEGYPTRMISPAAAVGGVGVGRASDRK